MVFVSIFFLWSKSPYINHAFVKSHVKSAFCLHIIMALTLFIMSYPFLISIHILWYSLNTIITATLCLIIFSGILYWMYMAHKWKTVTIGEIFHKAWTPKDFISSYKSEKISEENSLILILAHIPFFGYIIYPRHKELDHMRDITQLNIIVTLVSVLILIAGFTSLASLLMLTYIVYSVFQAVMLSTQWEITTLNLDKIPTPWEKFIIQKSLLQYIWNNLKKKDFIPLQKIIETKVAAAKQQESIDEKSTTWKYGFHIKNSLILIILFIICVFIFSWDSSVLTLFLFPIFYTIGYKDRKAYRMPYIYNIYSVFDCILSHIGHIFHKTRKLQKTQIQETIKMWEQIPKMEEKNKP